MIKARLLTHFTKTEISQLFEKARRSLRHPGFDILIAPASKAYGRCLIIIARVVGTAPERNLLRRRLKALFYEQKLYAKGLDCIIITRKPATKLSYDTLKQLLAKAVEA